jgi:glycosyltransferase involved in cell wall biosynthesis
MDGVKVVRPRYLVPESLEQLQTEGGGLPIVLRKHPIAWLAIPPFFIAQAIAAARVARDCHLVHAHWTLSAAAAWAGQFYHHCPFVVTVQGSDIYQAGKMPVISQLTQWVLARCNRVVCLSYSLAKETIALGVQAEKVIVVPNGVDTEKFTPSYQAREPLIVAVGSLIERKGMRYAIQAMVQVSQHLPTYQLAIIGDGPQYAALSQLAEALGIASRVKLIGIQPHDKIIEWLRRASLFVLPSLEEALGQVILEALATGTPCVGTRVGGIPDVITPDVGRLVPPADPTALADAIVAMLANPAHWQAMSENARHRAVNHFSSRRVAARLIEIYQEVIDEHYAKG